MYRSCMILWMHQFSSTSPPFGPLLFHARLPPSGRLSPVRASVRIGFAGVDWFRRFRSSPPPLVLFRVRQPPLFSSLALSGFGPAPGEVCCVGVCSFPLLRVALLVSRLSILHFHVLFIFTFISFVGTLLVPPSCGRGGCGNHLHSP